MNSKFKFSLGEIVRRRISGEKMIVIEIWLSFWKKTVWYKCENVKGTSNDYRYFELEVVK